jgi:DHA1 family bicyclomycin/chloramphenicol resistance-like MFS transporter
MVLLGCCSSLGPLALNVYLPGLPAVQAAFAGDLTAVQATVSLPLLAFGLGLVLLGPVADRYGRRSSLLAGLVAFIVGCLVAATAPTLGLLTLGRMIASFGTATTFITSRAIVADLTPPEDLQRSVAEITMVMLVVQMIAPILGNLVLAGGGWQAIQWSLVVVGVVVFLAIRARVPETLHPDRRAAHDVRARHLLAPALELLRRKSFLRLLLQVGLLYSAYPAFIAMAPHLMVDAFHRPSTEYSYYYALLPVGYFAGNAFVLRYGREIGTHRLVLLGSMLGILSAALSLVLLYHGSWHPLALFLPCGLLLNTGIGFAQQFVAAISVQLLALFPGSSPFPVVWICMGLVGLAFAIEATTGKAEAPRHGQRDDT